MIPKGLIRRKRKPTNLYVCDFFLVHLYKKKKSNLSNEKSHNHIKVDFKKYVVPSISLQTFFVRHLKLSQTLENSVSYCCTSFFFPSLPVYTYVYTSAFDKFPDFFVQASKIVVDSWEFTMLLLYILWDDWPIFRISASNQQLQQQFEYTLLKPDCHSWWISTMQSGREDTLYERYAIKFSFKLGKNATETYRMLQTAFRPSCMNRASVFWAALKIQGRQGVYEGRWEVWEE